MLLINEYIFYDQGKSYYNIVNKLPNTIYLEDLEEQINFYIFIQNKFHSVKLYKLYKKIKQTRVYPFRPKKRS